MDTAGYLTRQGWLGHGHALHPTGRGIKKPLLASHKMNTLGVGKNVHDAHSNQWWAKVFDSTLESLTLNQKNDQSIQGTLDKATNADKGCSDGLQKTASRRLEAGNLYQHFVKGEGLEGTLSTENKIRKTDAPTSIQKEKSRSSESKRARRSVAFTATGSLPVSRTSPEANPKVQHIRFTEDNETEGRTRRGSENLQRKLTVESCNTVGDGTTKMKPSSEKKRKKKPKRLEVQPVMPPLHSSLDSHSHGPQKRQKKGNDFPPEQQIGALEKQRSRRDLSVETVEEPTAHPKIKRHRSGKKRHGI